MANNGVGKRKLANEKATYLLNAEGSQMAEKRRQQQHGQHQSHSGERGATIAKWQQIGGQQINLIFQAILQ